MIVWAPCIDNRSGTAQIRMGDGWLGLRPGDDSGPEAWCIRSALAVPSRAGLSRPAGPEPQVPQPGSGPAQSPACAASDSARVQPGGKLLIEQSAQRPPRVSRSVAEGRYAVSLPAFAGMRLGPCLIENAHGAGGSRVPRARSAIHARQNRRRSASDTRRYEGPR